MFKYNLEFGKKRIYVVIMIKGKKKISFVMYIFSFLLLVSILSNHRINSVLSSDENSNLFSPTLNVEDAEWSLTEAVKLGTASGDAFVYSFETDMSGNLHIFWSVHDDEIYYKVKFAENLSWSLDEIVISEKYIDYSMTLDSNNSIHFAWINSSFDINYMYRNSTSGSWSSPVLVDLATVVHSLELAVDIYGNVHFLWEEIVEYTPDVEYGNFLRYRKKNNDDTWTSPYDFSAVIGYPDNSSRYQLDIITDSEANVHIICSGLSTILMRSWYYETSTWGDYAIVNEIDGNYGSGYNPKIDVDSNGNVHCIWDDVANNYMGSGADTDIFHRYWNMTSQNWSSIFIVSTESSSLSQKASLAVDDYGNLYTVWEEHCDPNTDIFFKIWLNHTQTWTTVELVSSESSGESLQPLIEVDKFSNVHCVWNDNSLYDGGTGYFNVFYKFKVNIPKQPILTCILPNPSSSGIINLDWSDVDSILYYNIYRSTSFIWEIDSLTPIGMSTASEYIDVITLDGSYYYVIEAYSPLSSAVSQCVYVEVIFPPLAAPVLEPIMPNPSNNNSVTLNWNDIPDAIEYMVYRSTSFISDINGLTVLDTTEANTYTDTLTSTGMYYYVIVAYDGSEYSTISNCHYVYYEQPEETSLGVSLIAILGIMG